VSAGGFQLIDAPTAPAASVGVTGFTAVQPGFFHTAGIPLRGRTFGGDTTGRSATPSDEIIVNERLARRLWPDRDALGQRVRIGKVVASVVGVAGDITVPGLHGDQHDLQLYMPTSSFFPSATIVFRTALAPDALTATIRAAVRAMGGELDLWQVRTADDEMRAIFAGPKFAMALLGVFALAALVLSAVGLYGVIAYAVGQRTREIGVRVALGAQPADVARLVLRHGAILVGVGLGLGVALSALSARAVQAYLYGVGAADPITYVLVVALLGAVALVASYAPARRAMRVDPVVALRAE